MSSPNLIRLSATDTDNNDAAFTIPYPSRRKCVAALSCLICFMYIAEEARHPTSASRTRDSRLPIVGITVTPSLSIHPSSSDRHRIEGDVGNTSEIYDAMPALFGRPTDHTTKARLINFNVDADDDDDTLCPNTDPLGAGKERSMEYLNIWPFAVDKNAGVSIGKLAASQRLNGYDSNSESRCATTEPVAILASRGKCSFEAKAMQALTNPPPLFDRNGNRNCFIDISYLIIYDDQPQDLKNEQFYENNDNHTISSPPLIRMISSDNTVKDDIDISLLFVSYETGMALRQKMEDLNPRYIQSDGSSNDAKFDEKRELILTLNIDEVESKRRPHRTRKHYDNDRMDGSNNDDVDDFNDDDFYGPTEDPARILFEQMITAMSLMFCSFFCIGCMMLCCCHPDDDGGNGWVTFHFDGRGFVFGRPDDGESVARLLTEEEVLAFPEVEFGVEGKCHVCYNDSSNDLEVGQNESIDAEKSTPDVEAAEYCPLSRSTLIGDKNTCNTDNEITSSPDRMLPLQHQTLSPLNNDSLSFNAMCSICLEEYEPREKIRVLPCQHMFHTECILPWLTERFPNCPLCKAQIIPDQTGEGNRTLNENDDEVSTHEYDDVNNTNGAGFEVEDGVTEMNDELSSLPTWRNYLFGSLSRHSVPSATATTSNAENELPIHYSEGEERVLPSSEDNGMSSLSTPLLQDS